MPARPIVTFASRDRLECDGLEEKKARGHNETQENARNSRRPDAAIMGGVVHEDERKPLLVNGNGDGTKPDRDRRAAGYQSLVSGSPPENIRFSITRG